MLETWPPVIRPRIFWMPTSGTAAPQAAALQKLPVLPAPTLKKPKLWNRLDPLWVPPVMLHVPPTQGKLPDPFTVLPRPLGVMFVLTWACTTDKSIPALFSNPPTPPTPTPPSHPPTPLPL